METYACFCAQLERNSRNIYRREGEEVQEKSHADSSWVVEGQECFSFWESYFRPQINLSHLSEQTLHPHREYICVSCDLFHSPSLSQNIQHQVGQWLTKKWICKDLEGSDRGLIEYLPRGTKKNHKDVSQHSRCVSSYGLSNRSLY
jgi:hypothetical protein